MNDGFTESLAEMFEDLTHTGDKAIEAVKEQIDIEAKEVEQALQSSTPVGKTGRLSKSLTKKQISDNNRYGYTLTYEGEDENGNSYEKIANVLNYGSSTLKPRKFITRAVKKLKGLDDRAAQRFEEKLRNKGGTDGN